MESIVIQILSQSMLILLQGIVVEDNAANLEAVLDPQDDQENNDEDTTELEGTEDVGEAEPQEEEAGEEVAAEDETGAEEESPEGGDDAE